MDRLIGGGQSNGQSIGVKEQGINEGRLIETERINCILSFYAKAETEGFC